MIRRAALMLLALGLLALGLLALGGCRGCLLEYENANGPRGPENVRAGCFGNACGR